MQRRLHFAWMILAVLIAPFAAADVPLTARLELVPSHALPAVPVTFVVTVTNPNKAAQKLTDFERLLATGAKGITFTVLSGDRVEEFSLGRAGSRETVIPAGGTIRMFLPAGRMMLGNGAFWDPRLCVPGTYDLQMSFIDGFRTNIARLTVDQPTGADLQFWNALLALRTNHTWTAGDWIDGAGEMVAVKFPASHYAPLMAWWRADADAPEGRTTPFRDALAAGVTGPLADDMRLQLVAVLGSVAEDAARSGNAVRAAGALAEADTILQHIIEQPSTGYALQEARLQRMHINGVAIVAANDRLHAPYRAVKPLLVSVQCRERNGSVRFNVTNPDYPTQFGIGKSNAFVPAPEDRQQPISFPTGKTTVSIPLLAGETTLSWHLNGAIATFSAQAAPPKTCDDADETDGAHSER